MISFFEDGDVCTVGSTGCSFVCRCHKLASFFALEGGGLSA